MSLLIARNTDLVEAALSLFPLVHDVCQSSPVYPARSRGVMDVVSTFSTFSVEGLDRSFRFGTHCVC